MSGSDFGEVLEPSASDEGSNVVSLSGRVSDAPSAFGSEETVDCGSDSGSAFPGAK